MCTLLKTAAGLQSRIFSTRAPPALPTVDTLMYEISVYTIELAARDPVGFYNMYEAMLPSMSICMPAFLSAPCAGQGGRGRTRETSLLEKICCPSSP